MNSMLVELVKFQPTKDGVTISLKIPEDRVTGATLVELANLYRKPLLISPALETPDDTDDEDPIAMIMEGIAMIASGQAYAAEGIAALKNLNQTAETDDAAEAPEDPGPPLPMEAGD